MSSWLSSALASGWKGSPWLGSAWGFGGADPLVFEALTYDPVTFQMLPVKTGTGAGANTRNSERYALNNEDLYFSVAALKTAWNGGRNVENLLTYSEDFAHADWITQNATKEGVVSGIGPNGEDAMEVSFTAVDNSLLYQSVSPGVPANTTEIIMSVFVRAKSGTTQIRSGFYASALRITGDITVTEQWKRLSYAAIPIGSGATINVHIVRQNTSANAANVYMCNAQVENAAGRADTSTPSEYVPTTTAAVQEVYANENGNTVASNVVTEAAGAAMVTAPWFSGCPAATNACIHSRGYAEADWDVSKCAAPIADQVGISGVTNTAWTLTDDESNSAAAEDRCSQTLSIPDDSNTHVLKAWIKKTTGASTYPGIQLLYINGATVQCGVAIDTNNGTLTDRDAKAPDAASIHSSGDFYIVCIAIANNGTGNISARIDLAPAVNANASGTWVYTTQGASIWGQAELHLNKTIAEVRGLPPIFTEGSTVSTLADTQTFDAANWSETGGLLYCEVKLSASQTELNTLNTAFGIFSSTTGSAANQMSVNASGQVASTDGAVSTVTTSHDGEVLKIALAYSTAESLKKLYLKVGSGSVVTDEDAYDGSFGTDAIEMFNAILTACEARDLRGYNYSSYTAANAKAVELMINYLTGDSFTDRLTDENGADFTV